MATAKQVAAKVRKLRDHALSLARQGKYEDAVLAYDQLCRLEPDEGEWPRRACDCAWHLKREGQRLAYAARAAQAYAQSGLSLKAIAMCKIALSIDPNHEEVCSTLAALEGRTAGTGAAPARRAGVAPGRSPVRPDPSQSHTTKQHPPAPREKTSETNPRSRMAAQAVLRKLRAHRPEPHSQTTHAQPLAPAAYSNARDTTSTERTAGDERAPLGRIKLKKGELPRVPRAMTVQEIRVPEVQRSVPEVQRVLTTPLKEPAEAQPSAPPLRSNSPEVRAPLDALQLKQHLSADRRPSLAPAAGNIYSLSLNSLPAPELIAARIPSIMPAGLVSPSLDLHLNVPAVIPTGLPQGPSPSPFPFQASAPPLSADAFARSRRLLDIPLLRGLDEQILERVMEHVEEVHLDAYEVLFEQGDLADSMYVILEGSVVAMTAPSGHAPIELARLSEGDFFGEIGLLSDQLRQASVSASEPTRLFKFDREVVGLLVDADPGFLGTLLQFLKDRLVEDLMLTHEMFAPFGEKERKELGAQFEFLEIEAGAVLLEAGQVPIAMYVLLTGEAESVVFADQEYRHRLGPGDMFGEGALLYNEASILQVRTLTKCYAVCLAADIFREVILTHPTVLEYVANRAHQFVFLDEEVTPEGAHDHIHFF